jgi:curli biogenesis system outer membrane secretion channel CsgG
MKHTLLFAALAASSAAHAADPATRVDQKHYELPQCDVPVARVVVGELKCKSAGCEAGSQANDPVSGLERLARAASGNASVAYPGIGDGMGAMLTTALKQTGCFDIQEREALDELREELALVGKTVEAEQAEFMISGAITAIGTSTQSKSFGGGLIPVVGSIAKTKQHSELALDLRIIDVERAKVVSSETFVADNTTSSTSWGGAAWAGIGGMVGGMSNLKGTPMESIVRDVLVRAASYASNGIVAQKSKAAPTAAVSGSVAASAP